MAIWKYSTRYCVILKVMQVPSFHGPLLQKGRKIVWALRDSDFPQYNFQFGLKLMFEWNISCLKRVKLLLSFQQTFQNFTLQINQSDTIECWRHHASKCSSFTGTSFQTADISLWVASEWFETLESDRTESLFRCSSMTEPFYRRIFALCVIWFECVISALSGLRIWEIVLRW